MRERLRARSVEMIRFLRLQTDGVLRISRKIGSRNSAVMVLIKLCACQRRNYCKWCKQVVLRISRKIGSRNSVVMVLIKFEAEYKLLSTDSAQATLLL